MNLIGARVAVCLLLTGILADVSYAQEALSRGSATSSGVPTAAPVKKESPATERVILKVGNVRVTQAEFESGFFNVGTEGDFEAEKELPAHPDRQTLGDNYASVLMLSQKAVADHLDSTPAVSRELAMDRLQILSNAEYASLMRQAEPTPEEISTFYNAHPSDYDEVQIRRLFIWKQHEGSKGRGLSPQDAKARADKIHQDFAAGTDPKKLSAELSSSGDGLLDAEPLTFPRGELRGQMEKVAFALKEGEWSEVQDTPESLIFVQLVKHGRQQLEEVSSLIEQRLQGQKMQTMLDDLKNKAGIWMDKQYFATAGAPDPGAQTRDSSPPPKLKNQ